MIFFLNRGLILEQEVVKALKKYLSIIDMKKFYNNNFSIQVTNQHPFARMLLSDKPDKEAQSLFPVIVVATETDNKPSELAQLIDSGGIAIEPQDIAESEGEDNRSYIEKRYDMITPDIMEKLRDEMGDRKKIYGHSYFIRRRDKVSIEIWAVNPQLKNELYEVIRLFVCGFMRDYLHEMYRGYFQELEEGSSPLTIFDSSINGERSNNFNIDFGIELHGAHITFEADYVIEQTVIDTEIFDTIIGWYIDDDNEDNKDADNTDNDAVTVDKNILEVINHVKNYRETTRTRIFESEGEGELNSGEGEFEGDSTGDTVGESEPNP